MTRCLALLSLALAACAPAPPADPVASDAWARATAPGQSSAAVYMTLTNRGGTADALAGARTPLATGAMIHRMDAEGGIARMRMVDRLDLAPGATIAFAPGGTHVMLTGLSKPLTPGATFPLTLSFERAGSRAITVTVVAAGAR